MSDVPPAAPYDRVPVRRGASAPSTTEPDVFRAELDRMDAELRAHLDYEEGHLLPVLATLTPPG